MDLFFKKVQTNMHKINCKVSKVYKYVDDSNIIEIPKQMIKPEGGTIWMNYCHDQNLSYSSIRGLKR